MAKDAPAAENAQPKITKHMYMADVVQRYPTTADVFLRFGLHCFGCSVAMFETVEQGAMAHGLDPDELVKELNAALSSSKKSK